MRVFFMKNIHITLIAIRMNVSFFEFLTDDAAGLIGMRAIVVFALTEVLSHLWEIVRKLLILNIQYPKLFDPGCINQLPTLCQKE